MEKNVGISYKAFAVILAAVLVLGGAIGGTMAWLIDGTEAVANVFTDSDINITLSEDEGTLNNSNEHKFKMIPGHTISKDPEVTVKAGSEDCYLFVKIDKSAKYDTYLAPYAVDRSIWTKLENDIEGKALDGVYYREVPSNSKDDQTFSILAGGKYTDPKCTEDGEFSWGPDQVLVKPSVTKSDMDAIDGKNANGTDNNEEIKNRPTLTFTAYAVQLYKTNPNPENPNASKFDVAVAWEKAKANEQNATNN